MKLLSWNIWIKKNNTKEIINFIKRNDFNILTFQEAVNTNDDKVYEGYRTKSDIEKAFINKYPFNVFSPFYGATKWTMNGEMYIDFGGFAEQGLFTLSEYKILEQNNQFYHATYTTHDWEHTYFEKNDHGRVMQNILLEIKHKKVQIINIHGIWTKDKQGDERTQKQCQLIVEKALTKDYPVIIVGDFNLLPNSKSIELMNNHFRNLVIENKIKSTKIIPNSNKSEVVLDYIFVNDKIKVNDFKVFNNNISDHLPLMLDFEV